MLIESFYWRGNLTTVLAIQILISTKSAICFFLFYLLGCILGIIVYPCDRGVTKPSSIVFLLIFEKSLILNVISDLHNNTDIHCRFCRTFVWISIIKLLVVSQASYFLIELRAYSCQRNEYTIFLPVILCSV